MGRTIAVVDDDRGVHEMLGTALELQGYRVVKATNGLRLISQLYIDRPDVILLDVMMSWIDGFDLCRTLKRHRDFRSIPVIFISARKSDQDFKDGKACGAADYFTKPLDLERLLDRVEEVLP